MTDRSTTARRGNGRLTLRALLVGAVAMGLATVPAAATTAATDAAVSGSTAITLTATPDRTNASLAGDSQGFSVESADFAHGFLTKDRMSRRLKTLGPHGVIRIGGYSMDLVWPALGDWRNVPAPEQAIGGTVDQGDFDALKKLLDDSGWQVTLGAPLKAVIDPAYVKDPTKDPSPDVSLEQVVAEVKAAQKTLGDDLLAVELGNEYDNVTTLTGAQYYDTMKQYHAAIATAVPHAKIRMTGPSANTAKTNLRLDEFVTAVQADESSDPRELMSELASHWYPGSHCGSSNMSIAALMSPTTVLNTRSKLAGIMDNGARLGHRVPSVINESNSASCSGQPEVSNSYATSLWSLDYLMQTAQSGVSRLQFHTNTAAICGDFKARTSPDYPISYRYYGAFCAADQRAFDKGELSATPLYYGLWAFRQVPDGRFVDLDLADSDLGKLRAYGVEGPHGTLTMVLVNVQDPASAESTEDVVTVRLPSRFAKGRQVTLASTAPGGLSSTDASAVTLGGRSVSPAGVASGPPHATPVPVSGTSSTVTVAPGTAAIVTLTR